jgi:hypothetical protein
MNIADKAKAGPIDFQDVPSRAILEMGSDLHA